MLMAAGDANRFEERARTVSSAVWIVILSCCFGLAERPCRGECRGSRRIGQRGFTDQPRRRHLDGALLNLASTTPGCPA